MKHISWCLSSTILLPSSSFHFPPRLSFISTPAIHSSLSIPLLNLLRSPSFYLPHLHLSPVSIDLLLLRPFICQHLYIYLPPLHVSYPAQMAILGKFEVNVIVDGEEAREYDDNEVVTVSKSDPPPTVSRYVEAVSGAFFGFRICVEEGYTIGSEDNIVAKVYVDGEYVMGRFIPLEKSKQSSGRQPSRRRLRSRIVETFSHVPSVDPDICNEEKMQFSNIQLCMGFFKPTARIQHQKLTSSKANQRQLTTLRSWPSTASLEHFVLTCAV